MKTTILISLLVSVVATIAVSAALDARTANNPSAPEIRASRVQIVDEKGMVRIVLETSQNGPAIRLRNNNGEDAAVLTQDMASQPVLYFNGAGKEAKVMLGYICGSDVIGTAGTVDCVGGWGLHVWGTDGRSTGVGFLDSGRAVAPLLSSTKKQSSGKKMR